MHTFVYARVSTAEQTNDNQLLEIDPEVGHDVENFIATDKAYNSVHPCCKYRDNKIELDHEGGFKKNKN